MWLRKLNAGVNVWKRGYFKSKAAIAKDTVVKTSDQVILKQKKKHTMKHLTKHRSGLAFIFGHSPKNAERIICKVAMLLRLQHFSFIDGGPFISVHCGATVTRFFLIPSHCCCNEDKARGRRDTFLFVIRTSAKSGCERERKIKLSPGLV